MTTVGVAIPSIPVRPRMLMRALDSVLAQTVPIDQISVAVDVNHDGAWVTRNRAMRALDTDWIAFLDDDDTWMPHHVEHLLACAGEHDAGMVWGWFGVLGGNDPFPVGFRGRQYDLEQPHCVPICYMVEAKVLAEADELCGGFRPDVLGDWSVQDRPLIDAIHQVLGSQGRWSYASPELTWYWFHHSTNTSGEPDQW